MKKQTIIVICIAITILVIGLTIPQNKKNSNHNDMPEFALLDDNKINIPDYVQTSINEDLKEKYGEDYQEVLKQNTKAAETGNKIAAYYTVYSTREKIYPDYYGGMYINDDQKLVLQIVKENIPSSDTYEYRTYSEVTSIADNEEIEYVKYSYNELKAIDDKIIEYFTSEYADYDNLIANYVDIKNNKIIVELKDNSKELQKEFLAKVINSKLIEFKQGQSISTAAQPGEAITLTTDNTGLPYGFCTRGPRVKLNAQKGFITSGHCTFPTLINSDVGEGTLRKFQFSGNVDAAFIQTGLDISNSLPSKTGNISSLSINESVYIIQGTIVGYYGKLSKGGTGSLVTLSATITVRDKNFGDITLTDQSKISATLQQGDSGGPIFTISGSNVGTVLGIVEGVGGYNSTYYTKYSNIKSSFGITRY